jgi:hypothetical protein
VWQRSNDYFTRNGRLQRIKCTSARAEEQSTRGWHIGQPTGPVRCTTGQPGGPTSQSSNGRIPTGGWRGGTPVRWRTGLSGVPIASKLLQRLQFWLVAINTTPTGHFKVWEPKQYSKSSSWHTQALPTTSIHWSILYTRFRPLQPTQVPQKREQAKESYSFEFSTSALWDSLIDSVCFIFVFICAWSFDSHWTSSKVLEACKS